MLKTKVSYKMLALAAFAMVATLGVASQAQASIHSTQKSTSRNCFREHLADAIRLNTKRMPLYSDLTNGESLPISTRLIALEKLTIAASLSGSNFDKEARPFRKAGVGILCEDFVDVSHAPSMKSWADPNPPLMSNFVQLDTSEVKRLIRVGLQKQGTRGAYVAAVHLIQKLEHEPRFNCLLRHSLESIARIAALAPHHAAKAKKAGLPSSEALSRRLIEAHLVVLKKVADLDWRAASIQARGVGIICQDVPRIPYR